MTNIVVFNLSGLDVLLISVALLAADWLLGVLKAAIPPNTLQWSYLFHQLEAQALALAALAILGFLQSLTVSGTPAASGPLAGLFVAAAAAYNLRLLTDIYGKASTFTAPTAPPPATTTRPAPSPGA